MTVRRPGQLNRLIELQQLVIHPDQQGGGNAVWTTTATVWAGIEPLRGREFFEARQVQQEVTHRITIRYRADLSPAWRVRRVEGTQARIWRIEHDANLYERGELLELMCVEEAPEEL